ncbi:hypothetical protein NHQ30_006291 [Ciborinia camelliae]|nr:hypothetical protein NHQ30_006291 [Ciborinia camelliae]
MAEQYIIDPDGDCIFHLQRIVEQPSSENEWAKNIEIGIAEGSSTTTDIQEVEFLVSSKHMMLASPVFKAMFQHSRGFKEGEELHSTGTVNIELPDDDPDAFLILANIVHCRDSQVPLAMALSDVCYFSILVDKYQMQDAVKIVSCVWIKALMNTPFTLKVDDDALLLWLCISWVFSMDEVFKHVTWLFILESKMPLSTRIRNYGFDLPIPERVIEKIDQSREEFITDFFQDLTRLITDLQTQQLCKSRFESLTHHHHHHHHHTKSSSRRVTEAYRKECDSMMLGSLTKGAMENGLYPCALPPFDGVSLWSLTEKSKSIKLLSPCQSTSVPDRDGKRFVRGGCDSNVLISSRLKSSSRVVFYWHGLELKDFKSL